MDSPLSIFSPDSYSYVPDEYSTSSVSMFGFGAVEDGSSSAASSSYSFASLSGLAEQLCSPQPPSSIASQVFNQPPAPSSSSSSSSSALDDFFSFDVSGGADFSSSDDDFFTPTFSVTDLPSPSNYRSSESDYYPSTPSPPSFSLAPALKTGPHSSGQRQQQPPSACFESSAINLSSVHSWEDNKLCDPQEVFFPLSSHALEEETTTDENGGECWWQLEPPLPLKPMGKLNSKPSIESLGAWDRVENVPEAWTSDETFL